MNNAQNSPQGVLQSIGRRDAERDIFRAKVAAKRASRHVTWGYATPKPRSK